MPFGRTFDSVRRIREQQQRLAVAQQPGHSFRVGRITTEHPVRSAQPQIAGPGYRHRGRAAAFFP